MSFRETLYLHQITVAPGAEWPLASGAWRLQQVTNGIGYCISGQLRHALSAGETMLVSPKSSGVIRSSQLGELRLCYFDVATELLEGVLTAGIRHILDDPTTHGRYSLTIFPAQSDIAQAFERLAANHAERAILAIRCELLALFARSIPHEACLRPHRVEPRTMQANSRFEEIIGRISEQELLKQTTASLAVLCACSPRHFARLFRAHFGVSVRAKRTQLRLERARQLLQNSDAKIIQVALDSGFHHLGLFNQLFRQHLGTTPSQWRKRFSRLRPARRGR